MKHEHCELIKKWADGAEIQAKTLFLTGNKDDFKWINDPNPSWSPEIKYRVKPEPLVVYCNVATDYATGEEYVSGMYITPELARKCNSVDSARTAVEFQEVTDDHRD